MSHPEIDGPTGGDATADDLAEDLAFQCLEAEATGRYDVVDELLAAQPEALRARVRVLLTTLGRVGLGAEGPAGLADPHAPPDRIGPFALRERIGAGTMGVVYRAARDGEDGELALKLLQPGLLPQRGARLRFRREIAALRELDHDGICPILDDGEADGVPYLAMPFVPGRSLQELLARGVAARDSDAAGDGIGRDELLRILADLARALHHAHERGFVHRDVKPANVIVRPDGRPVLLDFGLARAEHGGAGSALTLSGGLIGSPAYMAPEQVAGRADVDRRCDVYALGVMLYEGLTGRLPHDAPNRESLYRRILAGEITRPSQHARGVSQALDAVCMMALERDADRRYRSASELAEDLERVRTGRPPTARLPGPWLRTVRWVRRNPLPSALGLLLTAATLGVLMLVANVVDRSRGNRARSMAAEAMAMVEADPAAALRLALAAWNIEQVPESLVAMQAALIADQPEVTFEPPVGAGPIQSLCISADNRWLVAGAADGTALAWPLSPRAPRDPVVLRHGQGRVTTVAFRPFAAADQLLVTSGDDGRVAAFALPSGDQRWTVQMQPAGDSAPPLCWSPDGELLLVGGRTGARILRADGSQIADALSTDAVRCVAWLDARTLLLGGVAAGGADRHVVRALRFDAVTGEIEPLAHHALAQPIVALYPNPAAALRGRLLIADDTPETRVLVVTDERKVRVWDSGLDAMTELPLIVRGRLVETNVAGCGWSPDGLEVFATSRGGGLWRWAADGTVSYSSHGLDHVTTAVASPVGPRILMAGEVGVADEFGFDGRLHRNLGRRRLRGEPLGYSPDGGRIATVTRDDDILVWGRFDPDFPSFSEPSRVTSVEWLDDDEIVAGSFHTGERPGSLRRWDALTGRPSGRQHLNRNVLGIVLDRRRGQLLVATGAGRTGTQQVLRRGPDVEGLWRRVGEPLERMSAQAGQFLDDGRVLFADARDGVMLWEPGTGRVTPLCEPATTRQGEVGRWVALCATGDGRRVWAGGSMGYLHRYELQDDGSYREVDVQHLGDSVMAMRLAPDGSLLVSGANGLLQRRGDGTVIVFETMQQHIRGLDVTMLDDELVIASGDHRGLIALWRQDGTLIRHIAAHGSAVLDLRFSPDGDCLLSGAAGGNVRIWPVRNEELVRLARERATR